MNSFMKDVEGPERAAGEMFNAFEAWLMGASHFSELCPALRNRFPPAKTGLFYRRRGERRQEMFCFAVISFS